MSDIRKRVIAILAVACMALTAATGCSSKNKDNSSASNANDAEVFDDSFENVKNEDNNIIAMPFQTGKPGDGNPFVSAPENVDLDADDPVESASKPAGAGTSTDVEAPTEIVTVTDADGEPVTDSQGEPVTEIVTSPSSNSNGNSGNNNSGSNNGGNSNDGSNNGESGNNNTTDAPDEEYVSSTDNMYCLWMDISKNENFMFNGQIIKVTFKLKDGIPNRDYPVRFNPDLSSIAGQTVVPDDIIQGTIRVGSGIEAQDVSSNDGVVMYGDNISANAGDTVDYYINLKNNPGLAGMLVWVYYDSNAMELVGMKAAGEFAEIANRTQTGTSANNE